MFFQQSPGCADLKVIIEYINREFVLDDVKQYKFKQKA